MERELKVSEKFKGANKQITVCPLQILMFLYMQNPQPKKSFVLSNERATVHPSVQHKNKRIDIVVDQSLRDTPRLLFLDIMEAF